MSDYTEREIDYLANLDRIAEEERGAEVEPWRERFYDEVEGQREWEEAFWGRGVER